MPPTLSFRLVHWFGRALMLALGPVRASGAYRVPREGGVLILANHLSDCDPVVLQVGCPRPIRFMAKSELFEIRVLGPLIRAFQAFPVRRDAPDRKALQQAAELLKAGHAVCIFPEGRLSEDGQLQELKAGVALVARMAQVPVICAGLIGTNRVLPYGKFVPRPSFRRTEVRWGEPRHFDAHVSAEEFLAWAEGQLRSLTGQER